METVNSRDGTPIAFQRSGAGAPLVLVHGTGGTLTRWTPVLPLLDKQFNVYAMNRRGRGESGDSERYAIEREFEDVAAVADAIPEPTHLLGHSFGGICALEASLRAHQINRLVLYEPPIVGEGVTIYPDGLMEQLAALLEKGDREGVLTVFMREVVRMPSHEFDVFRASPSWPSRVAAAHTIPRELVAQQNYRFRPEKFRDMTTPTLLVTGGDSPAYFHEAIEMLRAGLPRSRVVILPGQQHIAIDTAPELFAREIIAFLSEPG